MPESFADCGGEAHSSALLPAKREGLLSFAASISRNMQHMQGWFCVRIEETDDGLLDGMESSI